jgi:hypothetical protein
MATNDDAKELKSITDQLKENIKSINDGLKSTDSIVKSTLSPFESLVTISQQLVDHKSKENELDEKGLNNLIKKAQESNKSLKDSQKSLLDRANFLNKEKETLEKNQKKLHGNSKLYKDSVKSLKKVTNEIDANNRAQEDLAENIASTVSEVENLENGLKKAAKEAIGIKVLKDVGKQIGKISTPMDNLLDPMALLGKLINFAVGGIMDYDKRLGDTAKNMNITYEEADKSNKAMVAFAKSTGQAYLNSENLNKSVTELNQQLGTSIKFEQLSSSLQKDVALMSRLENVAGLTAEETQSILKYTMSTGQSAEKATKDLMANYKIAGLKRGVVLNEKEALKEISKTSNAIKLSTAGGAAGLAKSLASAKALGASLDKVDNIAGSILNFEESIEAELSAELLLGKDLNLEKAREAALNNDLATLSDEIAKNVGSAAEFAGMNRIQQDAIAKAVGMSREELADSLTNQEALKNISATSLEQAQEQYNTAKAEGKEKEFLAQLGNEALGRQFEQTSMQEEAANAQKEANDILISTLGSMATYKEDFKQILDFAMKLVNNFGLMKGILVVIGAIMAAKMVKGIYDFASGVGTAIKAAQAFQKAEKMGAIASIIKGAWSSMGPIPFVGAALASAAVVGGVGYLISQMNDGVISPSTGGSGYGSRVLHGPEGAISFNNKDTIVAGTDLFKANDMVSAPQGAVQIASNNNSSKDIADLKSSIMALASRPVNVAIDGKKVIEATTGAQPNTQGLEASKNSYQIQ